MRTSETAPPPANDVSVPGEEPLGAEAGHRLERLRPLDGITLDLLGIAAIRRRPDHQIAREEVRMLGDPEIAVIVGLALGRVVAHLEIPEALGQRVAERERRPRDLIREDVLGVAELTTVDVRVQALRQEIASKPADTVLLRDDVWPLAGRQEWPEAERVIHMTVRVHRRLERRRAPLAHRAVEGRGATKKTRIDENHSEV